MLVSEFGSVVVVARDPQRRKVSRELQNARRKAERLINRIRKAARESKDATVKRAMQREAKNMAARVKRASSKGKTLAEAQRSLASLNKWVDTSAGRTSDAFVRYEMKRALDEQTTPLFGEGRFARGMVQGFFMHYRSDWLSAPSANARYDMILARHPGMSLYDLYRAAFKQRRYVGDQEMTWEQFVATYIGIDYSNVDTDSVAFNAMVHESYDTLDSGTKLEIEQAWARY